MDLRVSKTHTALIDSLESLLKSKDFDRITVKELCDSANIRTATFYNHFSDKYDFLYAYVASIYEDIFSKYTEKNCSSITSSLLFLYDYTLDLCLTHPTLFESLHNNKMFYSICNKQIEKLRDIVRNLVHLSTNNKDLTNIEISVLQESILGASHHIIHWWIENERPCSKDELLGIISTNLQKLLN